MQPYLQIKKEAVHMTHELLLLFTGFENHSLM